MLGHLPASLQQCTSNGCPTSQPAILAPTGKTGPIAHQVATESVLLHLSAFQILVDQRISSMLDKIKRDGIQVLQGVNVPVSMISDT